MPKQKNPDKKGASKKEDDDIKIKVSKSSIAEFTRRSLPTEKEVDQFEDYIDEEVRDEEIDESLNEIYQDEKGDMVDVHKLEIKRKRGFIFYFFASIFILAFLGAAGYGAYYYYLHAGSDALAVEFSIEGENEVMAAEEFFYYINYKNPTVIDINNVEIELSYPENFIFLDSDPVPDEKNNRWKFTSLPSDYSGEIKIKGKIIAPAEETGILLANIIYIPANFSSQFKKEASFTSTVTDIGLKIDIDHVANVLVGEKNEIIIRYSANENNHLSNFRLTFEPAENIELLKGETEIENIKVTRPGVWQFKELINEEREFPIAFKFSDKIIDTQEIHLYFEQEGDNGIFYKFLDETLSFGVMKNDLNLTLIINGSRDNQGVNFNDILNYSIVYANKGETEMKDVIIMAVMESDFLDWTTLSDNLNGQEKDNTISWSKKEIPELEVIEKNQEGVIDFSIKVMDLTEIVPNKKYEIESFVQFSIGNREDFTETSDVRSNIIINKINSDLSLNEQIRYFNNDNIAVGNGPLPPKVGETTSFKVYWVLENNLHELQNTKVEVSLPDYVSWDNKNRASVGTIEYYPENHQVVWQIGRLPISVYRTDAEFNVSITPIESDRNKIIVLIPGTTVYAVDSATEAIINKTTKAKTTKLEDDDIAQGDGIVE